MNTNLAETAVDKLTAQIGEALFGQPGLDLIEIANRCNAEASRRAGALLSDAGNPVSVETRAQFEAWAEPILGDNPDWRESGSGELARQAWQAALAARQPVCATVKDSLTVAARQPLDPEEAHILPLLATERMLEVGWPYGEVINASFDRQGAYADLVAAAPPCPVGQSFQAGVAEWMGQCFLPSLYSNMTERGDRLLEEVLELLQAHGYDKARVPTLVDYVFGRPVGEPAQEVGGVMVTLAGYCWVAGLDMHDAGDIELARINQPEVMEKIRQKQEAKNALHFDTPLPGNAASQPVGQEPVAWMTHHAEPMLFPTREEASDYCEDEESPIPLYAAPLPGNAAPPAQAVDLAENLLSVLIEEGVLSRNGRVFKKLRALIDSGKAVQP